MRRELEDAINKEQRKQTQVEELKAEFERLKEINVQHYAEATGFQRVFEQFETLKQRKAMLEDNRKHMLDGMTVMTGTLDYPAKIMSVRRPCAESPQRPRMNCSTCSATSTRTSRPLKQSGRHRSI
jgi:uncharacterized membrane protein YccC